jgi:histidine ammonia-lyase
MPDPVALDGRTLTLDQVHSVARRKSSVSLDPAAHARILEAADSLRRLAESQQAVYGVNTGFGVFANRKIDPSQSEQLSWNLILSHTAGLGEPFAHDVTRAAMLIRANTLSQGHSGIRPVVVQTIIDMLNHDVVPIVPSQGSLGSSGDLAPLAHMALVLAEPPRPDPSLPSGEAWFGGAIRTGAEAMAEAGIPKLRLGAKEGLALTNGASFAAALLALACHDAARLIRVSEVAAALSLEALLAVPAAFDERLHAARPHPGQVAVANHIRKLIDGSQLIGASDDIQDAYSLRCIPQVLGPALDTLDYAHQVVACEINSATDNPLLFEGRAISGGNFHGEPIGLAADYLKIALAEVGALAERRLFRLTDSESSRGLPPMLVRDPDQAGLQSGLMMTQYTAAALVLENQGLAAPDSVRSLPTSAGQEDLNANATTAARHLGQVLANLQLIVAIELLASAQALEIRLRLMPDKRPGSLTGAALADVRRVAPRHDADYSPKDALAPIVAAIGDDDFLANITSKLTPIG